MKENIDKSIKLLEFVIMQSEKTASYFHKQKRDFVSMFCLCMIDRLNFSSVALKALLRVALEKSTVEYSCGIILRAVFLDSMILLNAFEITKNLSDIDMPKELDKFCFDMLGDSVNHTLANFKELYSQDPKSDVQNLYSNLVLENPDFFEPYNNDGTPPIAKKTKKYTTKELVANIRNSADLNNYKGLYGAYLYYSKYDHFGQMFYNLSRKDFLLRLDNVNKSITYIPRAFLFAQSMLLLKSSRDSFLENQYNETISFINTEYANSAI